MRDIFKFFTKFKSNEPTEQDKDLFKVIEELQESIQILDLENRRMAQDIENTIEASVSILTTIKILLKEQKEIATVVNTHTATIHNILTSLVKAGLIDPDKSDPVIH